MTPDDRQPRKRRRRRRRSQGAFVGQPSPGGNGPYQGQPAGNGNPQGGDPPYPSPGGGRRRRRSRHRRRSGMFPQEPGSAAPIEITSGELLPSSGVLFIKPNGSGMLVQSAKNFVPQPGD